MGRYLLSDRDRRWLEGRCDHTFMAGPPKDGFFRLYNKNGYETLYVRPVDKLDYEMTWIVEVDGEVPDYFKSTLRPFHGTGA